MNPWKQIEAKILQPNQIQALLAQWREGAVQVVFTNGCFDLLHYGHIHYLAAAKAQGTHLVVGLNSSASVSRLKGAHRPIKDEQSRAILLAALACVDAVIIFEEDTPLKLIQQVKPDVLVKGGDWRPEQIVGFDFVSQYGGKVGSLDFIPGYSTTTLEEKIRNNSPD